MLHVFLLIVFVFVLVAFASFSRSPTVRRTATRAIYGSLVAALISAALAAWFFHREDHASTDEPRHRRQAERHRVLPMSAPPPQKN